MSTPTPSAANADAHREEDDDSNQDMATIPDDATPSGRDGGGGGGGGDDGQPPGGGAGGSFVTNLFSNRKVAFALGGLAIAAAIYFLMQNQDGDGLSTPSTDTGDTDAGGEPERDPMPDIDKPNEDPLQADQEAIEWVFGDREQQAKQAQQSQGN